MFWNKSDAKKLHDIISLQLAMGKSITEASAVAEQELNRPANACRRKWDRIPRHSTSSNNISGDVEAWTHSELQRLYDMRQDSKLNFVRIGKSLNRTALSCKKKFQNSSEWFGDLLRGYVAEPSDATDISDGKDDKKNAALVTTWLDWLTFHLGKNNYDILCEVTKSDFEHKAQDALNASEASYNIKTLPVSFEKLKQMAKDRLESWGLAYPKETKLGKGRYLIVGDSHGCYTSNGIFRLLSVMNETLMPDKIIHIGHISDDENKISFNWKKYKNLIVVGMDGELQLLKSHGSEHEYMVYQKRVELGKLTVANQYEFGDYTKTFIGNMPSQLFPCSVVTNAHRHELFTRCTYKDNRVIASPGCLCRPHIIRAIKQCIFKDGSPQVKLTLPTGYRVYSKRDMDSWVWEQGLLVVEVAENGDFTIIPCRIFKTSNGYATSYLDKIITEKGVERPSEKIMITADAHCDLHDPNILDIQEQFCETYEPDKVVNVGDICNNASLNHHEMAKTGGALRKDFLQELAATKYILKRMVAWSKKLFLIYGNHERFMKDFVARYPQLESLFSMECMFGIGDGEIVLTPHKKVLEIGPAKFVHGDQQLVGQSGSNKMEKMANTYGPGIAMGNIHYPGIRYGCYSIGFSGNIDQGYNEPQSSQWMHGFGICNIYKGLCFMSTIGISDQSCIVGKKRLIPRNLDGWKIPTFRTQIVTEFDICKPSQCVKRSKKR